LATVSFKNGTIYYEVYGKGRALVFLHGFLENTTIWKSFILPLSKQYKIVLIDLPGHGKSDCYGYIHSMELMAQAVNCVLAELNLRKYIMVGHSMGGYVSLAYCELFPENIKGLVLFHSTALADTEEKIIERNRSIHILKQNRKTFLKGTFQKLFYEKNLKYFSSEIVELETAADKMSKRSIIDCLEGMKTRLNREVILKFAQYPVLFIYGLHDNVVPYKTIEQQLTLPKNSFTCQLKLAAHIGMLEEPTTAQHYLKRFIKVCHL
jgi:pimeloyl-ACP methyl ester carboxylesterase